MDRVDLLVAIEKTAAIVRIYREEVLMNLEYSSSMAEETSYSSSETEDASLQRAVRNLHQELNVLLLPSGKPCSKCNGSGVES
jgi:hypothetical protein